MRPVRRRARRHEPRERRPAVRPAGVAQRLPHGPPEPPPAARVVELEADLATSLAGRARVDCAPREDPVQLAARAVGDERATVLRHDEPLRGRVPRDQLRRLRRRGKGDGEEPDDDADGGDGHPERQPAEGSHSSRDAPSPGKEAGRAGRIQSRAVTRPPPPRMPTSSASCSSSPRDGRRGPWTRTVATSAPSPPSATGTWAPRPSTSSRAGSRECAPMAWLPRRSRVVCRRCGRTSDTSFSSARARTTLLPRSSYPVAGATFRARSRRPRPSGSSRPRWGRRRARYATARSWSSSTAPGFASPRQSGWTRPRSTSTTGSSASSARAARSGWCRSGDPPRKPCGGTSPSAGRTSTAATARSCS